MPRKFRRTKPAPRIRPTREQVVRLLAETREKADPDYVVDAAGFWMQHQAPPAQRSLSAERG